MKAHELLAPEGAWTQGVEARDLYGKVCSVRDSEATSYCLLGALYKCYPECHTARWIVFNRLDKEPGFSRGQGLPGWNDKPGRTQAEVVALLKELDI